MSPCDVNCEMCGSNNVYKRFYDVGAYLSAAMKALPSGTCDHLARAFPDHYTDQGIALQIKQRHIFNYCRVCSNIWVSPVLPDIKAEPKSDFFPENDPDATAIQYHPEWATTAISTPFWINNNDARSDLHRVTAHIILSDGEDYIEYSRVVVCNGLPKLSSLVERVSKEVFDDLFNTQSCKPALDAAYITLQFGEVSSVSLKSHELPKFRHMIVGARISDILHLGSSKGKC